MSLVLGIDNGLTVSKVVLFDEAGRSVAVARRHIPQLMPIPRYVERDMDMLWQMTAAAIKEVLEIARCDPHDISAVAATAHGDGLYLADVDGRPLRNGILSLDSRAQEIVEQWNASGVSNDVFAVSGQVPHASAPSALLAWVQANETELYAKIGYVLSSKDWLRYCLTGVFGTDPTEASTSFTDVKTQEYSTSLLQIMGLESLASALPEISGSCDIVGVITKEAAVLTSLVEGTPVVAGLHDVTASSLGSGGYGAGIVSLVAGTYSINQTISNAPKTDKRWFCRNGICFGEWNNMSISPASAANYDWFLDNFFAAERVSLRDKLHDAISHEVLDAIKRQSVTLYHPYLFGSPSGARASASFVGLRGWQNRGDMLKALIEGIAFNHRLHVDSLRSEFAITTASLTGGISRNPVFAQLFADVLGVEVKVSSTEETAAWGAALCAGASVGIFDLKSHYAFGGEQNMKKYLPNPKRTDELNELYQLHCRAREVLTPLWEDIEELQSKVTRGKWR